MEEDIYLVNIQSAQDLLDVDTIINIPYYKKIKLIFENPIIHLREDYGEYLHEKLPDFLVAIHGIEPEINIRRLISKDGIVANQSFFIQCAKDYRKLGSELVKLFCEKKKIKLNERFPHINFYHSMHRKQGGKVGDWEYFIHGYHCHFLNVKTKQEIEVPFMFGMEFGDLDPYFFVKFIKSTPEYYPLPINLDEYHHDGERVLEVMSDLGLLERINSILEHHSGLVIKDRGRLRLRYLTLKETLES